MTITLLGTGSPLPSPDRAGPSTLVRTASQALLVDCGRGVVMRLAGAGLFPNALDAVLLTHLHSDHITDLNDIITTHWVLHREPTPLRILGPQGTRDVVDATLRLLGPDQKYRMEHHDDLNQGPLVDVNELEPDALFAIGDASVEVFATDHHPVTPTVGYRISSGGTVAAIAGDTVPCPGLDAMCASADFYVQTVIRSDLVRAVPSQRLQDILDYHSTVEQAAQTAARAGVGTLVLTHYVPPMSSGDEDAWRALAAAHFDGEVVLGDDLTSVTSG